MCSRSLCPTVPTAYASFVSTEYSDWSAPGGEGTPIPDAQIEAVRSLVERELPWSSHPFLKIGQRVRIRSGALDGMEGILLSRNGDRTLVISVEAIQRSLAVRVEGYEVEPV